MSLFTQPFAVPSRIKGAVQLVAGERGHRIKREAAEALLSPSSLKGEEGNNEKLEMVRRTIDECIRLRLFIVEHETLKLNPDLPAELKQVETVPTFLPQVILDLLNTGTENDDMIAPLAWFLAQEVTNPPANWTEFGKLLQNQGVLDLFKFNDTRYANFWYWSRYLGFTTVLASNASGSMEEYLLPDPTDALRRLLRRVFTQGGNRMTASECLQRLSATCQVFEFGRMRETMDEHAPKRAPKHLSPATSLALLRLEEEGVIEINLLSDADALILVDGPDRRQASELVWRGTESPV
jgi:hypothetical protein